MKIIRKIRCYTDRVYRQKIACEQYPMLTFVNRKKWQSEGAIGMVFMLHHVTEIDHGRIPTNEALKVSPTFLEKLITRYKAKGFDFISLDQLYDIFNSHKTPERPFVTFTIDDGYLDNYTKALPVFERQEVPFAVFIATNFIEKKAILWWDSIEELIMTHDSVSTSDGKIYPCRTFQERWDTFRYLRKRVLNLNQGKLVEELDKMFSNYHIDWYGPVKKNAMSWEHVISLANHPLCTIGGHTISHLALKILSEEAARHEIKEGLTQIEHVIQKPVRYFAYPYGTPNEVGEREFGIISEAGIRLAFMAHQRCIKRDDANNTSHLPRIILKEII